MPLTEDATKLEPKLPSLEERYSKYRDKLQKLTLMSDILSRNVLKDMRCTEHILRVILNDKNLTVIDQTLQVDYKNLHGRSVILDCLAKDSGNRKFNIELQQNNEGAHPKRARYHLGMMDSNALDPGQDFDKLPESYIIFITQRDVLNSKFPILHINRIIEETGKAFGDQSHFIYVDASKQNDDTELGRLMHDLTCRDPADMYNEVLAEQVRLLKETERGVEHMCKEMDELCNEAFENGLVRGEARGEAKGEARGRLDEKKRTARKLNEFKMSLDQIAHVLTVDVNTVKEWLAEEPLPA